MRMNKSAILGMEYDEFCMAGCIFYGVYMRPYRQDPLNVFKVMILIGIINFLRANLGFAK